MEKKRNIGIALLITAALLIIFTGVAFAAVAIRSRAMFYQSNVQLPSNDFYGPMGRYGGWSDDSDEFPPMMDAMVDAISEATGLSVDEINVRLAEGERLYTIALDAGLTEEELDALMDEVHSTYYERYQGRWNSENRSGWMFEHMQEEWEEHGFDDDNYGRPFGGCW